MLQDRRRLSGPAPRTEAVLNFVWSSSDVERRTATPCRHGRDEPCGPAQRRDTSADYRSLGHRGRAALVLRAHALHALTWAASWARNRHQDIRGTFPGPAERYCRQGLAAQDGKFFEKSWALSIRPDRLAFSSALALSSSWPRPQLRFHRRAVGRGLAGRRRPAGHQHRQFGRWSLPLLGGARVRF